MRELVATQYALWKNELQPELAKNGIRVHEIAELTAKRAAWAHRYFRRKFFQCSRHWRWTRVIRSRICLNRSHNLLVARKGGASWRAAACDRTGAARRAAADPDAARQRREDEPWDYIYLASLIKQHIGELFPGLILDGVHAFRVTRNSDLYIDEEEAENLLRSIEQELRRSSRGNAVRLEVEADCPKDFRELLLDISISTRRTLQTRRPAFHDASHAARDE